MTFFSYILAQTTIKKNSVPKKVDANSKQPNKSTKFYYFGQNRFWFYTK